MINTLLINVMIGGEIVDMVRQMGAVAQVVLRQGARVDGNVRKNRGMLDSQ